jgi:tRNA 2-selenouridine synthase SelU
MASAFRNNTRSVKCGTSCSSGQIKNLFASIVYQAWFDENVCEAMDKESKGFAYLRQKFPKISEAKVNEGIFIGPQIKQLFKDQDFSTKLNSTERRALNAFENTCRNFLGSEKVENCSAIVQELILSYSAVGVTCH